MLSYNTRGDANKPPLVMLHGLFGTRENLATLSKSLSEHFYVYCVDLPNHGRSDHVEQCGLMCMAEQLKEWMNAVDLHRACLFGHSLGGKVAMELALSAPEHIAALIVADMSPAGYAKQHQHVFNGLRAIDLNTLSTRADADTVLKHHVLEAPIRQFLLKNLYKTANQQYAWRMNLDGLSRSYPSLIQPNREGQVQSKVLFLKAENSDYIVSAHQDDILRRFPNAQLKTISNTAHWLHAEKPALIYKVCLKFLSAALKSDR